jgi:hypothetical protein
MESGKGKEAPVYPQLRACANRRVAYAPTGATKAVGPPAELLALGSHFPIGVTAKPAPVKGSTDARKVCPYVSSSCYDVYTTHHG